MNPESNTVVAITVGEKEGEPVAITTNNDVPDLKITKLIFLPLVYSVIIGLIILTLNLIVALIIDDVSLLVLMGIVIYAVMRLVLPLNVYKKFYFAIQSMNMEHRKNTKILVAFEVLFGYLISGIVIYLIIDSNILHDYSVLAMPLLAITIILYYVVSRCYKNWREEITGYPIRLYLQRDVDKFAFLLDSNNLFYREFSLYALSDFKDKRSFDLIKHKLINSQSNSKDDIVNRNHIYHALRNLNDKRVITVLKKAFEKELKIGEMKLAVSAAINLSKLGHEAELEKIKKIKEETADNIKKWNLEKGIKMFSDKDLVDLYTSLFNAEIKKASYGNQEKDTEP